MTGHGKAGPCLAGVLAAGITIYSAWSLLDTGVLSWHIRQAESVKMLIEFLVVWLLLTLFFFYGTSRRVRLAGLAVLGAGLAWLHAVFFPVVLAGLYIGYLTLCGRLAGQVFLKRRLSIPWAFTVGSAVTVTVYCLMSLLHQGSIGKMRLWVLGSGTFLLIWYGINRIWKKMGEGRGGLDGKAAARGVQSGQEGTGCPSLAAALALAAIGALCFLQMSRMNVAVDFDSIWYGVRSHLMLDSGNSIYENLGTLGVVYTYPKGWEVLTLPLAGLPSYSFLIAFNLWTAALVLLAGYEAACVRMKRGNALWVPFLMAAVPGIMNMACTAKADLITLLFQLLMIHSVLQYEKERRADWLVLGASAALISFTMKPTALVYSTAVGGLALVWVLWDYRAGRKRQIESPGFRLPHPRIWLALVPSMTALAGIWGRTLKLVGVPVTSVFYELFQKLGFTVKYPFCASGFPSSCSGMSIWEKICFLGGRLYGVLLNPQGEDMSHVVIAWGTVLPLVLMIVWLCMRTRKRGRGETPGYLPLLTAGLLAVNLISLYSLSQIDGNYYVLFYGLVILDFCIWGEGLPAAGRRVSRLVLLPAWAFAVVLCTLTSWSWALGNGGVHLRHGGYYDHVQAAREQRTRQGSGEIWNILAADPRNRVIALGEVPDVLTFPCCVQSYVDVSGYWGNPEVVADAPDFLQYLLYADIDYLYMEKGYVCQGVRIYDIIRELVEQGWLGDVRGENGNLILSVRKDGPELREARQNLEAFDHHYIQHP